MDNKVGTSDDRGNLFVESPYVQSTLQTQAPNPNSIPSPKFIIPRAPFPNRLRSNKKLKYVNKILEVFKQVQVNIPLLDMIK